MKRQIVLILGIAVVFALWSPFAEDVDATDSDNRISAKIGIMVRSGDEARIAASRDMVKPGDLVRIFVHPEKDAYIYVVYTDGKNAKLLNVTMQKFQGATLCLPSIQSFYRVDGNSPLEKFTIVCSSDELAQLSVMADKDTPHENWQAIEAGLSKQSKILLTREENTSVEIAGNVRGPMQSSDKDLFVEKLPFFSGKGLLVKTYEFKLKK